MSCDIALPHHNGRRAVLGPLFATHHPMGELRLCLDRTALATHAELPQDTPHGAHITTWCPLNNHVAFASPHPTQLADRQGPPTTSRPCHAAAAAAAAGMMSGPAGVLTPDTVETNRREGEGAEGRGNRARPARGGKEPQQGGKRALVLEVSVGAAAVDPKPIETRVLAAPVALDAQGDDSDGLVFGFLPP